MKYILLFIFSIMLITCNDKNKVYEENIKTFENLLGVNETQCLNAFVDDFNSFLESNYTEKSGGLQFEQYLIESENANEPKYWDIDSDLLNNCSGNSLFAIYDSIYPDSIWYDFTFINLKFKDFEIIQSIIPISNIQNIDSLIVDLSDDPRLILKEESSFYMALDSIKSRDKKIEGFINAKLEQGNLSPAIVSGGILYDFNENELYFSKRIFVMTCIEHKLTFANNK